MNILLTGGLGYIGSAFLATNYWGPKISSDKLTIVDNMTRECYQSLEDLEGNIRFIQANVQDHYAIEKVMKDQDIVIHLAALTNAPLSFDRREEYYDVNLLGTLNILARAIEASVKEIIFTSTTSVYGETKEIVDEESECCPLTPYGTSKLMAEEALMGDWIKKVKIKILRLGTVFGDAPAIRFHTVINKFAFMACAGMPLPIFGTGEQKRPFLHINDAVRAINFFIQNDLQGIYNVVGENLSVNGIIKKIEKFIPVEVYHQKRESIFRVSYEVSNKKLTNAGFTTEKSVEDGIEGIISRFSYLRR